MSGLGLGMMRLPVLGGNDGAVDEAAAAKMIDYAYKNGINYFDTAWGYHDGNSELVAGKYLSAYPRESYYLASKFPGYDLSNMGKASGELSAAMQSLRPEETVPGWAFRFLQSIPGVTVVLSGMSDLEQLKANIITWETDKPLNGEEFDTLVKYADEETKKGGLPCTACHYCTSHCPKELRAGLSPAD